MRPLYRLFKICPQMKELFSFFKDNPEASGENEGMRKHGLTVMETVNIAVERVRNDALAELSEDLFDVGAIHHTLQVDIKPEHFAVSAHLLNHFPHDRNVCQVSMDQFELGS